MWQYQSIQLILIPINIELAKLKKQANKQAKTISSLLPGVATMLWRTNCRPRRSMWSWCACPPCRGRCTPSSWTASRRQAAQAGSASTPSRPSASAARLVSSVSKRFYPKWLTSSGLYGTLGDPPALIFWTKLIYYYSDPPYKWELRCALHYQNWNRVVKEKSELSSDS